MIISNHLGLSAIFEEKNCTQTHVVTYYELKMI